MKKSKKQLIKNAKGITLVALVVTIVILLILAGVTITMTLGQNGLFTRAQAARKEYKQSEVQEDLSMLITQYTWDKVSEKTDKSLGDYLKDNGATSVKENSDGKTLEVEYKGYVFTVDKDSGEITKVNKVGDTQHDIEVVVSDAKVTEDFAGQGTNVKQGTIAADSGKKLYITFTSSIEGGTTTVSPAVPFEVSKNGSYEFTITGTVENKTYSRKYAVKVNQYDTSVLIGKMVSYTPDVASDYELNEAKSGYSSTQKIDSNYDPTSWRIMDVDENGNITELFGVPSSSQTAVYLYGAIGYNNGGYLLNDICAKRYKNTALGASGRSLNIEDIESRMNEAGIAARNNFKAGTTQYGTTRKYKQVQYPAVYTKEKYSGINVSDVSDGTQIITGQVDKSAQLKLNPEGKNQSDEIYTSLPTNSETVGSIVENLTCTQTFYNVLQSGSFYSNTNFYDMIFGTKTVLWVASRCVECNSDNSNAYFGIRRIRESYLNGYGLYIFDGDSNAGGNRLAPVVTFDSAVQIKSGTGTEEDPYIIEKINQRRRP